jgi:hypothetical protein
MTEDDGVEPGLLAVLIVLGLIGAMAWPMAVRRARRAVEHVGIASAAGWGLLAIVMIPIAALLFAVTIVGLPIAVLILAVYAVGIVGAAVVAACVLGDRLLSLAWAEPRPGPVWQIGAVLIGSVALWLVTAIDVLGPILWVVAIACGLGIIGATLLRGLDPDDDVIDLVAEPVD